MSAKRSRFALCVAFALLAHLSLLAFLMTAAEDGDKDMLQATRAIGSQSADVQSETRAAQSQAGNDARSVIEHRVASESSATGGARSELTVTRFVMIANQPPSASSPSTAARPAVFADDERETHGESRRAMADRRAEYLAGWQNRIEGVAGARYAAALRTAAGHSLTLAVRLAADGSLRDVRVLRSSGRAEVDDLARRIVREAAPFDPFDDALARRARSLQFAYDWVFDTSVDSDSRDTNRARK